MVTDEEYLRRFRLGSKVQTLQNYALDVRSIGTKDGIDLADAIEAALRDATRSRHAELKIAQLELLESWVDESEVEHARIAGRALLSVISRIHRALASTGEAGMIARLDARWGESAGPPGRDEARDAAASVLRDELAKTMLGDILPAQLELLVERVARRIADRVGAPRVVLGDDELATLRWFRDREAPRLRGPSRRAHDLLCRLIAGRKNPEILASDGRCPVHEGSIHGGEAEELRAGVEQILAEIISESDIRRGLQGLLDRVNARDSLGHLEKIEQDNEKKE